MVIRGARPADEDAVLALFEELFDPPGRRPRGYTRARGDAGFRHALANPGADILLAVAEDGAIIGLASVYVDLESIRFGRRCWLEDLVVTARRRSQGIGRRLLDAATAWARDPHITPPLEAACPVPPLRPADPGRRGLDALLEDYADEWVVRVMLASRWLHETDAEQNRTVIAADMSCGAPEVEVAAAREVFSQGIMATLPPMGATREKTSRSEEHTSELQSRPHLVCRLLLEKKK